VTLKEGPAAVLAGGRTAGSRPSPPCKVGSAEGRIEEHLNEATITRLGSILECGNMSSHLDCRAAVDTGPRSGRRGREPAGRARCSPPMRKISWPTSGSATRCLARGPLPGHRHARVPVGEARRSTWSLSQKYGREAFDFDKSRAKPRGAVRYEAGSAV
jgi:hypothetical protein